VENVTFCVALVREVFPSLDRGDLTATLRQAKVAGAELAILPELPLNQWSPAVEQPQDADAESPNGPRHQLLSACARDLDLAIVGGAIVRDPQTGRRHNTALVFNRHGELVTMYRKVHLPEEAGFWETRHYSPGDALPTVSDAFGLRLGLQICSDINRPEGSHLLGALGAEAIINPRATEAVTFARWRTVLMANAMTSGTYVISVPRPRPEFGVPLGGPSFAVAPTGEIMVETTETIAIVTLDRAIVEQARTSYPGYLATRADLYAKGWRQVKTTKLPHEGETQ
jgi:predicted amidohydrolase